MEKDLSNLITAMKWGNTGVDQLLGAMQTGDIIGQDAIDLAIDSFSQAINLLEGLGGHD